MSLYPADLVQVIVLGIKAVGIAQAQMNEAHGHILTAAQKLDADDPEDMIKRIEPYADSPISPEEIWERIKADKRNGKYERVVDELWRDKRLMADQAAADVADSMVLIAKRKIPNGAP